MSTSPKALKVTDEVLDSPASAVIDQRQGPITRAQLGQQRLDKLAQVIHLLELAATVLIHFPVAREDVQGL